MKIEIEIAMDAARMIAALQELRREGGQRRALYPKFVADGKLTAEQARQRLAMLADAYRIVEAAVVVVEPLPYMAGAETPKMAATPPLPYDKTESLASKGAPKCRFCSEPGKRTGGRASDTWICATTGCMGSQCIVSRAVFQG